MTEVVSFRPTPEEARLIERTRRRHRMKSRAEAVRFLINHGPDPAERDEWLERVLALRAPPGALWKGERSITSAEIDEILYGEGSWPDDSS